MYSRECISETIFKICDHFGLIAYECFDIDAAMLKFKIEDQYGNPVDTIKIATHSFNKGTLDKIWDKLSSNISDKSIKKLYAKKCEYCDGGRPLIIGKTNDQGVAIQYPGILNAYGYDIHGSESNGLAARINYCPMCGKNLKGKQND